MTTEKPKVAFYWCASCGGCEETVVDLNEAVLDVVAAVDIIFWPCAMDFKYEDVESMPDKSITVAFVNGAIRNSEQEEVAKMLRKKAQFIIAFGSCAHMGGIPGLANLKDKKAIFHRSYLESPTNVNPDQVVPVTHNTVDGHELEIPEFYDTVYKLDDVIDVDYYIPGCPPTSALLANAVTALLEGKLPPKGTVLAPDRTLCETCERNKTKPDSLTMPEIKRVTQVAVNEEDCFLAQGVLCMGPSTRGGCEALCVNGNMPCTGCFGPLSKVHDQGSKILAGIGGIGEAETEQEMDRFVQSIPDPAGTFYRYGVPASYLGSKTKKGA